jgi:hypothetical protein
MMNWRDANKSSRQRRKNQNHDRTQPLVLSLRALANTQFQVLNVAALYFDNLYILDPADSICATIGAHHHTGKLVRQSQHGF